MNVRAAHLRRRARSFDSLDAAGSRPVVEARRTVASGELRRPPMPALLTKRTFRLGKSSKGSEVPEELLRRWRSLVPFASQVRQNAFPAAGRRRPPYGFH